MPLDSTFFTFLAVDLESADDVDPGVAKVEDAADAPVAGSPLRYDKASLRPANCEAIPPWRDAAPLTTQSRLGGISSAFQRVKDMAAFLCFAGCHRRLDP